MIRSTTALMVVLVLTMSASKANAGSMYLEWLDCSPAYKLWAVSWKGPWTFTGKFLDKGSSNNGPWSRVLSYVSDSNCYFPAENLKWYRIASSRILGGYKTRASIWVPRWKCGTGSLR
ncbi:MAG: hypothetical protein ACR2QX_12670 [Woeseiaceae bacterium]